MKKKSCIALTGILFFSLSISIAQPTITATGINPVIGESITAVATTATISPGNSGANQTWNLSAITGSSASTTVVAPSSTTNGSSFPNATVCYSSSLPTYYKTSSTAYQYCGVVNSGGVIQSFSNLEDFLRFPFTYTNSYTDAFAMSYLSNGYMMYRTGTITVTADGWGTLTTPNGTFSNILRVHLTENYQDSTNFSGVPFVTSVSTDQYFWYKEGTHASLAAIVSATVQGITTTVSSYITNPVGINEMSRVVADYSISPNPASDKINLSFVLDENKNVEMKIFNSLGEVVKIINNEYLVQGQNITQVDVSTLPNGVYFSQIISENNIPETRRFVVSK